MAEPSTSNNAENYNYYEFKRSRSTSPFTTQHDRSIVDLAYMDLERQGCEEMLTAALKHDDDSTAVRHVMLNNNVLMNVPKQLARFVNLAILDMSSNQLKSLCKHLHLPQLKVLILKDNILNDTSLPKDFADRMPSLEVLNLSGNQFTQFPYQLLDMDTLRELNLGSNKISVLPRHYENLHALEVLYLGGNELIGVPDEISQLRNLTSLNLADNRINLLPRTLAALKKIKTLSLHGNRLTTLPIELVKLKLEELSLRNNPLVNRFAKEHSHMVPSLLELSGRVIKRNAIEYKSRQAGLPRHLVTYLNSAQCCLNPACSGVYFQSKFECIKFVDFCGKYRVPLMQYLCSSQCDEKAVYGPQNTNDNRSSAASTVNDDEKMLKKIYLG